jgi:hypothetical protein
LKKCESEPFSLGQEPKFLVIPLGLEFPGAGVFEEDSCKPNGLVLKAHFFIETGCFVRARLMLELVEELGQADEAVLVTLASLQLREGLTQKASTALGAIDKSHAVYPQSLVCRAELERCLGGVARAMTFLRQHEDAALPELMAHLEYLQAPVTK